MDYWSVLVHLNEADLPLTYRRCEGVLCEETGKATLGISPQGRLLAAPPLLDSPELAEALLEAVRPLVATRPYGPRSELSIRRRYPCEDWSTRQVARNSAAVRRALGLPCRK